MDFLLVYTSTKPLEIAAAISLLEDQEIPAYKINKKDSSYIFGEIELYVSAELADRAKLILTENDLL
ncbi:MAG: putative signal transducing protein [Bacteroidia bacterium]